MSTEKRHSQHGTEDSSILRALDNILLCSLRWDGLVQRGQAYDGRGLQQHATDSRHGWLRIRVCPGTVI